MERQTDVIRLGFDLDGVLCDFNTSFLRLLQWRSGLVIGPCGDLRDPQNTQRHAPNSWAWFRMYGFHPEHVNDSWVEVARPSTEFWRRLEPIHSYSHTHAFLYELTVRGRAEVYFITSRPGETARQQSYDWLVAHGAHRNITVLVSSEKGHIARALGLDLVVDDHTGNVADVLTQSNARVLLVEALYNSDWRLAVVPEQYSRVDTVTCQLPAITGYLKRIGVMPSEFRLPKS